MLVLVPVLALALMLRRTGPEATLQQAEQRAACGGRKHDHEAPRFIIMHHCAVGCTDLTCLWDVLRACIPLCHGTLEGPLWIGTQLETGPRCSRGTCDPEQKFVSTRELWTDTTRPRQCHACGHNGTFDFCLAAAQDLVSTELL